MSLSRIVKLLWFLVALALVLPGCRTSSESNGRMRIAVAVGSQTDMVYLPTTLAQRLGYYEEEGLTVAISDTASGAKALEALIGGSADVVTGFYDHTIQMAAQGKSLKAFISIARYLGGVVVTSPTAAARLACGRSQRRGGRSHIPWFVIALLLKLSSY